MVLGIGVDMVYIPEIKRFLETNDAFEKHTFSENEKAIGENVTDKSQYYAGLFASKEAVFKAIGHLTKDKLFDFRCVETLHHEDGAPYINPGEELLGYMEEAGVTDFKVSITNENDYAIAFVIAQ